MVKAYKPTNISATPPKLRPVTQQRFDKGVISLVGPANLPLNALVNADNMLLDEDGRPTIRPGVDYYGTSVPASLGSSTAEFINLVTNPSFESGTTTGWAAFAGTTIAANTGAALYGTYSMSATSTAGVAARVRYQLSGLTPGQTYKVYLSVLRVSPGSPTITLAYTTDGSTELLTTTVSASTSAWYPMQLTFTTTTSTPSITIRSSEAVVGRGFRTDGVAVGVGLTEFFDGNTVSTTSAQYSWTGTQNASTSQLLTYDYSVRELDGGSFYVTSENEVHLVAVSGGTVFRSTDNGETWDTCTGASFTSGKKVYTEQANGVLYMYDTWDNIIRYTGSTTLISYTSMKTPVAPGATTTGMAGTDYISFTYGVVAVNDVGYTPMSTMPYTATTPTVTIDRLRSAFDDSNYVTLTWYHGLADLNSDGVIDALDLSLLLADTTGVYPLPIRYDLYVATNAGDAFYFDSIDASGVTRGTAFTYVDKGQSVENPLNLAPEDNTTTGPRIGDMAQVGTRLCATEDRDFPWRLWISGAGTNIGKFGTAFDGTYVDLQKGSQFRPKKVVEYQDGKGNQLITVWCDGVDGRGCIWQGTIDTFTVGDVSFPVPNFHKLPGSRGTNAKGSVVNVLNDFMYYNSQAIYNLGPRAQFLNLLSTDESSANIRPDIRATRDSASENIAAYFFDNLVYFSIPWNADENNRIMIYDTEHKAWLPKSFSFGVERFFQYTDTEGVTHLLCWQPGDFAFTEISQGIEGDYGEPFETDLLTGLVHANPRNRMDFMWIEEAEFELDKVDGTIDIELIGMTRENGFGTIDSRRISPSTTPIGWTTSRWTKHAWTDGSNSPITNYSEATTKRYFNIQQDVNYYQWHITSNDTKAKYIERTLQVSGTDTEGGKPPSWEMLQ